MAKQRTIKKKATWGDFEYPTTGEMSFVCNGYVQDVKEGDEVDYITFYLANPFKSGNTNSFNIDVPWDDDLPQLEIGDHVNIFGLCRSWWNKDIERVTYSFVAQQVEVIDDSKVETSEPPKKSRRGVEKPI